jgi:hypothetical protein
MQQNLAEEDDPSVVARRVFKALCALYPDRYLMLVLSGDVLVLPGDVLVPPSDVASDPPPAAALTAPQSPTAP